MNCLVRQFNTFGLNEVVVVINTLDEEFKKEAVRFCTKNDIEHYVTESDGTPGTGKNSVIKLFLESDNQYMVHIDGDDFMTPYGRNVYRAIAHQRNPPDLIALYHQPSMYKYDFEQFKHKLDRRDNVGEIEGAFFPHQYEILFDNVLNDGQLEHHVRWYTNRYYMDHEKAVKTAYTRLFLEQLYIDYGDGNEAFNRMVFFSRKAAQYVNYTNEIKVGEDTVEYYKLKKLALEGKFDMRIRDERQGYTYIYMEDYKGIISTEGGKFESKEELSHRWDWLEPLLNTLYSFIRELPKRKRLEEVVDPYYEVNKK
jgi:hypothetical protein